MRDGPDIVIKAPWMMSGKSGVAWMLATTKGGYVPGNKMMRCPIRAHANAASTEMKGSGNEPELRVCGWVWMEDERNM